ncbi:hypothetical protein HKCCE3408_03585 [Rhodobacterales bacterium HKCCE3408]|nr:hypothetical protein [Rhodobacterales bacterium HKCCE3408]
MMAIVTIPALSPIPTTLAQVEPRLLAFGAVAFLLVVVAGWIAFSARRRGPRLPARRAVVIDGSNVMHWNGGEPSIETVRAVVHKLSAAGYQPGVVFDANAGYLLTDRYLHDGAFAFTLGLPSNQVMVVPKGTPADVYILTAAREMGAPIVTNDRYRDWASDFPEVTKPGHLIRGRFRDGVVTLEMPPKGDRTEGTGPR